MINRLATLTQNSDLGDWWQASNPAHIPGLLNATPPNSKEDLQKAAQELNALGFEPKIDFNNDNVDLIHLQAVITGRLYSLMVPEKFESNKEIAIAVFINLMQGNLSKETLKLIRNLLETWNAREVENLFNPGCN